MAEILLFLLLFSLFACACSDTEPLGICGNGDLDQDFEPPFPPAAEGAAPDPMAPGPFPVGVRTYDFNDDSRPDPETGEARFLRTEIWYPAVQWVRGEEPWIYRLKDEVDENIDLGDSLETFTAQEMADFPSSSVRDAQLDRDYGPYPVILFSHGANSLRFQYLFITEHLASHGYVVVAVDHTGNTLWDLVRDGFDPESFGASASDRPADMRALLNQMEKINAKADHFLEGMLDIEHVGISGHSFGGFTAMTAACQDTRFKIAVLLSPLTLAVESYGCEPDHYPVPLMLMGGTMDRTLPWKNQYCTYRSLSQETKYLYELEGGGHFTFSDLCGFDLELIEMPEGPDPENDGCSLSENVPYLEAHRSIRHYATAFFNQVLRQSPGSAQYLKDSEEAPLDSVNFYEKRTLPDWPDGGCL